MASECIDTRKDGWRVVVAGLALLLVQGCATMHSASGGGFSLPDSTSFSGSSALLSMDPRTPVREEEGRRDAEARRAEVEWALARMGTVASGEEHVGSTLEFTFWVENEAFTLLSFRSSGAGDLAGSPLTQEAFTGRLRGLLLTLAESRTGALTFTLHREQRGWRADSASPSREIPPEARRHPARRTEAPEKTLSPLRAMAQQVVRLLQVPAGASAHLRVEFSLEDERVTAWEPGLYDAAGGGTARPAEARTVDVLVWSLLPFTRGLGPRTVQVELSGTHDGKSATSHWRVERAETLRPEPADEALEDVLREYRLLHAEIFHRYHEEMVDSVVLAGSFTLEQVALCAIGGLLGKGLHVAFEAVAPTVMRVVTRGGAGAMRWFRTQLVRAGRADQELMRRLWTKIETEGFEALSTTERNELTRLLKSMEQALTIRVGDAKQALRAKAQKDFYGLFHPELSNVLRDARGAHFDIHHMIPLEYAHVFPEFDINAAVNLNALDKPVHKAINKVWNIFRKDFGDTASPEQVRRVADITKQHFERWFNKVYDSNQSGSLLEETTQAALDDVRILIAR